MVEAVNFIVRPVILSLGQFIFVVGPVNFIVKPVNFIRKIRIQRA